MQPNNQFNQPGWLALLALLSLLLVWAPALAGSVPPGSSRGPVSGTVGFLPAIMGGSSRSTTYYLSPTGNDSANGATESQAWGTFNRAWQTLEPGDTLILLDGVYYQSLNPNQRNGEPGNPITIRAKNDGQAIIDGQYQRVPVKLGETWPGPIGDYFVIEGIVARNSNDRVIVIDGGQYNVLRRVSAYNANTNTNSAVIGIIGPSARHNLIEDCVASGTGRKMIYIYKGEYNTVRRCLADWREWDGREWCDAWPWGDNLQIYNGNYNTIENSIGFGPVPLWSISVQANSTNATAIGNKVLGSIAIRAGMNNDGTVRNWGDVRPQPTSCTLMRDFNWPSQRVGFMVYGTGEIRDNLFQDIFSWGNAGLGISFTANAHPGNGNNLLRNATIVGNGLDNPDGPWPGQFGGIDTDVIQTELNRFSLLSDNNISQIFIDWPNYPTGARNMTALTGNGARLTNRYVDGILTAMPLWPWPMEDRIQAELGISVTGTLQPILFGSQGAVQPAGSPSWPAGLPAE